LGLPCQYKRFCSALVALVGPVENIFFLPIHYFNTIVPIAQKAGQASVLGTLSLSMRLCSYLSSPKVCSDSRWASNMDYFGFSTNVMSKRTAFALYLLNVVVLKFWHQ
jgi:hypothetical protein